MQLPKNLLVVLQLLGCLSYVAGKYIHELKSNAVKVNANLVNTFVVLDSSLSTHANVSGNIPLGGACTANEECLDHEETTWCHPVFQVCYCRDEFEPYKPPGGHDAICIGLQNELGGQCYIDSQCTRGVPGDLSACIPSPFDPSKLICSCIEDAINEAGQHKCYPKRLQVGDQCDVDAQCYFNLGNYSSCSEGECSCISSSVSNLAGNKCLPIADYVGEECEEDQQCTEGRLGENSGCVDSNFWIKISKTCQCHEDYDVDPVTGICQKPKRLIGLPCKSNDDCVGEPGITSGCRQSGICACLGGHIPSSLFDNCLPIQNQLGTSCVEPKQCQLGIPGQLSDCLGQPGTCNCTRYSVSEPTRDFCHRVATLVGDPCQVNVQCEATIGPYSHCIGSQCECKEGTIPSSDKSKCIQ